MCNHFSIFSIYTPTTTQCKKKILLVWKSLTLPWIWIKNCQANFYFQIQQKYSISVCITHLCLFNSSWNTDNSKSIYVWLHNEFSKIFFFNYWSKLNLSQLHIYNCPFRIQFISNYIRPNKINVLVLRQRRPLKISADGTFLLPYRQKIAAAPYFLKKYL